MCTIRSGRLQRLDQATNDAFQKPFLRDKGTFPCDIWTIEGNYLIRHHRVPRRILFSPKCALDCPISEDRVLGTRVTELNPVRQKGPTRILEDDWLNSSNPNRDLSYLWTGRTRIKINLIKLKPASTTTASTATSLAPDGDCFPDHWDNDRKEQSQKYYKAMPEEFYTKTGRRPITPRNVKSWMASAEGRGLRFQFLGVVFRLWPT